MRITAKNVISGQKIFAQIDSVNFVNDDQLPQMTLQISSSPERHTFQRDNYIKRCLEEGKSLDDPNVKAMIDMYNSWTSEMKKI